jgi:hypothetical protein
MQNLASTSSQCTQKKDNLRRDKLNLAWKGREYPFFEYDERTRIISRDDWVNYYYLRNILNLVIS